MESQLEHGVPEFREIDVATLKEALRRGWSDMRRSPLYSVMFASAYVAIGLVLAWVTWVTGKSYWLIFAAVGFPLVGPFAACGFYEVSRCLERGEKLDVGFVCSAVVRQGRRQLPSLCAVIIMVFLFWFFLAHMIFALFLGLSTMTNVSSSLEVFTTPNGMMMLAVGSLVGALFALLLFMITVIAMPLLHDREVDFVTAMITSFDVVLKNPVAMFAWALVISVLTFVAMVPAFLGLYLILPLLGHASWHLYDLIAIRD